METRNMHSAQNKGFTLIELMIVIAIIGALAAFAIPSYNNSRYKAWRAEGRAAVMQALLQQEREMTQKGTYVTFNATTPNGFNAYSKNTATDSAYVLEATACAGQTLRNCILITATPIKADPEVMSMSKNSFGDLTCSNSNKSICWP